MMPPRAVLARREAEFAAAATAQDVAQLQRQWIEEDRQREQAAAPRASEPALMRRLAAAEKRIAQLERALADRPRTATIADAVGKTLADLRHEIGTKPLDPGAVREAVGAAMAQLHAGIWRAERGFPQGCMVTHDGSLWLAATASTGIRPGSGAAAWQLVVKGHHPRKKESNR